MTSEPTEAYVWVWLPDHTEPVVAGRLTVDGGGHHQFLYGRSYRSRADALDLYLPELPLTAPGVIEPLPGLDVAGLFADAAPDAWGRRVVESRRRAADGDASLLTLLLESGSDRIGALDFQASPHDYEHRGEPATLEQLLSAADALDSGMPLPAELDQALLHGSSIGGARPKAALVDGQRSLIAKFSSTTDVMPVVTAEAAAMELARRCGVRTAATELVDCFGRDVLLVERFDRGPTPGQRRSVVSALTILELPEHAARHATYHELADQIRARFDDPDQTLHELFRRIVVNVAVSNTDDHARNHSAFWNGASLELTPAYDICPQARTGGEQVQAMAIDRSGARWSTFACCRAAAPVYHLSTAQADAIIDEVVDTIRSTWAEVAEGAGLTDGEQSALWGRQVLNPYAFEPAV